MLTEPPVSGALNKYLSNFMVTSIKNLDNSIKSTTYHWCIVEGSTSSFKRLGRSQM
jgi:hypothetical protein